MSDIQRYGAEFQRVGKDGFDASVRSLSEMNTGFQASRTPMMNSHHRNRFEVRHPRLEQLAGANSVCSSPVGKPVPSGKTCLTKPHDGPTNLQHAVIVYAESRIVPLFFQR